MKKHVKTFIFVMIMFVCLFVNINGVKADGGNCAVSTKVSEAYACDYSSDNAASNVKYTMFFIKNSSGGYCAEIADLSLTIKGGFFSNVVNEVTFGWTFKDASDQSFTEQEKRQVAGIELDASTIKSVFDNKSCPRLKMNVFTYDFGDTGAKKLSIATEDSDDWLMCQITAGTSTYFNEFCVLSDGTNGRTISKEEAQQTVEDATEDRDGANLEKIIWWAEDNGYDNVDSLGDDCSIISNSLKDILSSAFWIICIAGIILVVVMTAISFIKAITGSDDEKFRDAIKNLFTRLIVIIILLMLPALLTFIINIINSNITGTVSIGEDGNVFCDISK